MALVSIYTVGRLQHPYDHPSSRDFFEVGNKVFRQATRSGQLVEAFSSDGIPLPEEALQGDGFPIVTLTVWKNLQSLYRFTYSGQHRDALRDRSKWMEPYQEKHLSYVVWWTEKLKDVSWEEAFKRYSYFIQHGPTPFAFDFKHAFDERGDTCLIK
ncbi:DUF3291 domain-containing protein [Domibacillus sp. PGB-M46]|uniref:DUF3291 domain-containing protein n=1 Tax=Domibacillus sp. PGB-M46 TaxID=2910255 RepID=UPI001F57C248|nr:DUF3291 domain-containing protein [Domibacillus sp. PGB-M46]MCI2256141.1 DUF3291 domain-containing protein [Domibacillus sp. PGB-M46]